MQSKGFSCLVCGEEIHSDNDGDGCLACGSRYHVACTDVADARCPRCSPKPKPRQIAAVAIVAQRCIACGNPPPPDPDICYCGWEFAWPDVGALDATISRRRAYCGKVAQQGFALLIVSVVAFLVMVAAGKVLLYSGVERFPLRLIAIPLGIAGGIGWKGVRSLRMSRELLQRVTSRGAALRAEHDSLAERTAPKTEPLAAVGAADTSVAVPALQRD